MLHSYFGLNLDRGKEYERNVGGRGGVRGGWEIEIRDEYIILC